MQSQYFNTNSLINLNKKSLYFCIIKAMKTINQSYEAKITVKKSIFIAHLCPFVLFKDKMAELKDEHHKAVHFVYALRYLNEFAQIVEDKSDDGEPKGTSALPCLNVLRFNELVNVAVIVVRYFGGIKLGTGGLVKAYSNAVNAVLSEAFLCEYQKELNLSLDVKLYSRMKHYLLKNKIEFNAKFSDDKVFITAKIEQKGEQALLDFAQTLSISP